MHFHPSCLLLLAFVPSILALPHDVYKPPANYGKYPPPAKNPHGKYGDYGYYKREGADQLEKKEAEPEPAPNDYTDYGYYGSYGDYGSYNEHSYESGGDYKE